MAQGTILKPYFSLSAVQELLLYMLPFNMPPPQGFICVILDSHRYVSYIPLLFVR